MAYADKYTWTIAGRERVWESSGVELLRWEAPPRAP